MNLGLCLKHQFLVSADDLVLNLIQVLSYHGEVIRHSVVVSLMISVGFLEWIGVKFNFLLHLNCCSSLHQVNERGIHVPIFSYRICKIKLLRVGLMPHKNIKERTIKVTVV